MNLQSLQNFSYFTSWGELDRMSPEEFDAYLADRGLLWKTRKCPNCLLPRSLSGQFGGEDQGVRLRFQCSRRECRKRGIPRTVGYLKDTFFEQLRGSRKSLFLASVLFVDSMGTVEDRSLCCNVSKNTITQWDQWFRNIIVETFFDNEAPRKIGGPNTVLQLEEACIAKRKCTRGRLARDSWVVGGMISDSREIFVEITPTRDSATLDSIITKHVLPGTTIGNLGYVHNTVSNEQSSIEDLPSDMHIQGTEGAWYNIERAVKLKGGLKGALGDDHFLESVWKWQHNSEPRLYLLWSEIAKRYPLID